ncbi:restriction endonuclease subunit S [Sphingobium sp.]|uniref:restriction endonuclease subunit S n=1 Tax=Sphingobium sp. TaxID=1912891 RepID=UPI0035C74F44
MITLRDLLLDSRDGEWGKGEPFGQSVHMQAIRGTDFEDVRLGNTSSVPDRHLVARHAARKKLQKWDIVFETAGGSKDRPTGRSVLLTPSRMARFELPVTCASFARFLRIDPEKADPEFVFWLLQDMYHRRELLRFHTQHTGVARFQFTTFADTWPLNLPPRPVQRRIADILSAYDDLIENNTRRIAILEDMARRLFDEWFGRDADVGDREPVRIDTLIDFDPKTKVTKEGRKPFLPMPCVPTNSMVVSDWEEREGNAGSKFLNGDTLLARITPCLENGKTAFVDFLPDGAAGFGSTEFIVMRGRAVPPEFVYCLARSEAFREHAIKSMSGATGRQRVSSAAVAQFEIVSPHPERLEKFGEAARRIFSMVRSLADANTNLRTTRDLLLPKLISGEIEVCVAEEALQAAAA